MITATTTATQKQFCSQAKDFGPPVRHWTSTSSTSSSTRFFYSTETSSDSLTCQTHTLTHSQLTPLPTSHPPSCASFREVRQLLVPTLRVESHIRQESSGWSETAPKNTFRKRHRFHHEPRMFSCIYLFYNIVCIYMYARATQTLHTEHAHWVGREGGRALRRAEVSNRKKGHFASVEMRNPFMLITRGRVAGGAISDTVYILQISLFLLLHLKIKPIDTLCFPRLERQKKITLLPLR